MSVGEGVGGDRGGEFRLHEPRGAAVAANLATAIGLDYDAPTNVRPETGLFVFFPSWMPHSVKPYTGEGTRISIAFNLARPQGSAR